MAESNYVSRVSPQVCTLTPASETEASSAPPINVFLKPLSFPEPETKDLSHFLDPTRDVPIVCLIPNCSEVFGTSPGSVREKHRACETSGGDLRAGTEVGCVGEKCKPYKNDAHSCEDRVTEVEVARNGIDRAVSRGEGTNQLKCSQTDEDACTAPERTARGECISSNLSEQDLVNSCEAGVGGAEGRLAVDGEMAECQHKLANSEETSTKDGQTSGKQKAQFGPKDEWLRHLFLSHKLVIDKVQEIGSLKSYSLYWRVRFSQALISEFAAVIQTNSRTEACYGPPDNYYLLSDCLPEDKQLRVELQHKKLEAILLIQQQEREDTSFSRTCLFCSHVFTGNRSVLFQHMLDTHSFNIGQPDNLVFVNELLDLLQQKLNSLQCLYCEKVFRDYTTLKDHMRKKQHKKIDGKNHAYDRFYAINYLQFGKGWQEVQAEDDREILPQVEESEWGDWKETEGVAIFCLFCPHSSPDLPSLLRHMSAGHGFDYQRVCRALRLDYYGQVKLVNFIRRQVHLHICCYCKQKCHTHKELTRHMDALGHYMLPPDRSVWDQSQYFFPTFENDALLFVLDDSC